MNRQTQHVEEIIKKFEPTDYKSQALALSESIDELMKRKGVKGFRACPETFDVTTIENLVQNLKMVYNSLMRLPNYNQNSC